MTFDFAVALRLMFGRIKTLTSYLQLLKLRISAPGLRHVFPDRIVVLSILI